MGYIKNGTTGEDTKDFDVSDQMSHRSFKSLTTILFPKVTFSDKQKADILAKLPRGSLGNF